MRDKNCPKCNIEWEEEQTIYQHFLDKYKDEDKAKETAALYGCTKENPKHFSKNLLGIEILGGCDGVSFWKCTACGQHFDRWTMKEVDACNVK